MVRKRDGAKVLVLTFFLVSTTLLFAVPAAATQIPSSIGDWTVTGITSYNGGTSVVTGDIVVATGGALTLNNLTMIMEGTMPEDLSITVEQGGSLFIHNSIIKAADPAFPYLFTYEDGSIGLINGSTIQNVGSSMGNTGLLVEGSAADVTIRKTTLQNNHIGLLADGSRPELSNCTISDGYSTGILVVNGANPKIKDSMITRFTSGTGIKIVSSEAELIRDTVATNRDGIALYSNSQAKIVENVLRNNIRDGLYVEASAVDLLRSEILENGRDGIRASGSSVIVEATDIKSSVNDGIMVRGSNVLVRDLAIVDSGAKDLALYGDDTTKRSHLTLINTTYSTIYLQDPNPDTTVEVYWYVSIRAVYQSDGRPVSMATVWLEDKEGEVEGPMFTSTDGTFGPSTVLSYKLRNSGMDSRTPHKVTVTKGEERQDVQIDISDDGADLHLVFDDVRPAILLDKYPECTNQAQVTLSGSVALDTAEVVIGEEPAKLTDGSFTGTVDLAPGNNKISIQATDQVKNTNTVTVSILRDVDPPKLIITEPMVVENNPIHTNKGSMVIAGQTEANAQLWINNEPVHPTKAWDFEVQRLLSKGYNEFMVKAMDLAGNLATVTIVVDYDPDLPELTITSPSGPCTNQETVTVTGTVDDPETKVTLTVNGVETHLGLAGRDIRVNVRLQEGANLITLKATDMAGNSVTKSVQITLDTIAPQLIVDSPINGLVTSAGTIHVSGMTDEDAYLAVNGGGAYYRNGMEFYAVVELEEGKNLIEVVSSDKAGNSNIVRVTVRRDSVVPTINILSPDNGHRSAGPLMTIYGQLSEECSLTMNGHVVNIVDDSFQVTVDLVEGTNTFVFEARDLASNIGATSLSLVRDSIVILEVYKVDWVAKDRYSMSGRTDPDASLTIDGQRYEVGPDGFFRVVADIREGTDFTVEVRDSMGNIEMLIMSAPAHGTPVAVFDWSPIVLVTSLLLVIGALGSMAGTERGKLFALFFLFVPLYSKMKKNTVLDHYTRGQIHGYIVANPGDHYNSIKQALKLNNGTLAYHLRVLEKEGIIKSKTDGIYKRFYPSGMKVPDEGSTRLTEIQKIIIKRIKETPGISQKEMSRIVGVSPSTVNYHIGILKSAGLVRSERRGMKVGYYLERIEAPPKPVQGSTEGRRGLV